MKHSIPRSGAALLADYQTVMTARTMAATADLSAQDSEAQLMQELGSISSGNYLRPQQMDEQYGEQLSRASLDAHVKKIQAQQVSELSAIQIAELDATTKQTYIGANVLVRPLDMANVPIDAVWYDQRYGERAAHMKRAKRIKGTIIGIELEHNVLILRPPRGQRLLNRSLVEYQVYIIDPKTLQPLVDVSFS